MQRKAHATWPVLWSCEVARGGAARASGWPAGRPAGRSRAPPEDESCEECHCLGGADGECGDGTLDDGEECGEPGAPGCGADEGCEECGCVEGGECTIDTTDDAGDVLWVEGPEAGTPGPPWVDLVGVTLTAGSGELTAELTAADDIPAVGPADVSFLGYSLVARDADGYYLASIDAIYDAAGAPPIGQMGWVNEVESTWETAVIAAPSVAGPTITLVAPAPADLGAGTLRDAAWTGQVSLYLLDGASLTTEPGAPGAIAVAAAACF